MYSKHSHDWIDWDDICSNNIIAAYTQRRAEYEAAKVQGDEDEMRFMDEQMTELKFKMSADQRKGIYL